MALKTYCKLEMHDRNGYVFAQHSIFVIYTENHIDAFPPNLISLFFYF